MAEPGTNNPDVNPRGAGGSVGGAGGTGGAGGAGRKSIMRSLGEFFGHIAHAVRTDPSTPADRAGGAPPDSPGAPADRQVLRRTVEEEERETPRGKVTLRRTIIEEVDVPREDAGREG